MAKTSNNKTNNKKTGNTKKSKNDCVPLRDIAHPVLYEVNTRVLLRELSAAAGTKITLGTIPDAVIDEWARYGFNAVWMMGVWSSGPLGIAIAREDAPLKEAYRALLPDFTDDDVTGSPYAVHAYEVPAAYGGEEGLQRLRSRLAGKGIGLVLDFVPNHTARDHAWVRTHPEYYVRGKDGEEGEKPDHYFRAATTKGDLTLAFGRDPGYAGWTDTAQLNPRHPGARKAMITTLKHIAMLCDGVRCDMAMLVLDSVFERTWGERGMPNPLAPGEFWREAIEETRADAPGFLFIAETYWNMEWDLQQRGFDYTYDKTLYDRLLREGAGAVRDHLRAETDYQKHSLRFIENHDEPRAAQVMPSEAWQYAAATVIATVPGMVMFHDGEFEGRRVRIPVQLSRRPAEKPVARTQAFYRRLLKVVSGGVFQKGTWRLLVPRAAWNDNYTWQNFLIFWWQEKPDGAMMVVVNYAPHSGQCYADIPLELLEGTPIEFRDQIGEAVYTRERGGLGSRGMYFDVPSYGIHIFEVTTGRNPSSR